jgi:hypothetical protein
MIGIGKGLRLWLGGDAAVVKEWLFVVQDDATGTQQEVEDLGLYLENEDTVGDRDCLAKENFLTDKL